METPPATGPAAVFLVRPFNQCPAGTKERQTLEAWFIFFGSIAAAMILSNLCSLMEAAILSLTPSQLAELRQKSPQAGKICQALKKDIDKPIAVILIINTAAHTIGAAVATRSEPCGFRQTSSQTSAGVNVATTGMGSASPARMPPT